MFSPLFSQISLIFLSDRAFQTSAYFGFSNMLPVGKRYLKYRNSLCVTVSC